MGVPEPVNVLPKYGKLVSNGAPFLLIRAVLKSTIPPLQVLSILDFMTSLVYGVVHYRMYCSERSY